MKKITEQGSFINFKGEVKQFVICACVQSARDVCRLFLTEQSDPHDTDLTLISQLTEMNGVFSVGLAVCHEKDKYNSTVGIKRAEGRAKKVKNCTLVMPLSNVHAITPTMMQHMLLDIISDIKRVPGKYIPGYNSMEEEWQKKMKKKNEQETVNILSNSSSRN